MTDTTKFKSSHGKILLFTNLYYASRLLVVFSTIVILLITKVIPFQFHRKSVTSFNHLLSKVLDHAVIYTPRFRRQTQPQLQPYLQESNSVTHHPHLHQCVTVKPIDWTNPNYEKLGNQGFYYNQRLFCILSSICLSSSSLTNPGTIHVSESTFSQPLSCHRTSSSLLGDTHPDTFLNCTQLKQAVVCENEQRLNIANNTCPTIERLSSEQSKERDWVPNTVVVVPPYANLFNIYHFSHVITSMTQMVERYLTSVFFNHVVEVKADGWQNQQKSKVIVLFRGNLPKAYGDWQDKITNALISQRLNRLGIFVELLTMGEDQNRRWVNVTDDQRSQYRQSICARDIVMLGQRDSRAWPFANFKMFETLKQCTPMSVPIEALLFKAATYSHLKLPTVLPVDQLLSSPVSAMPERLMVDLPPLSVGYSRRNVERDPQPGQFIRIFSRRFSDADEEWFTTMLQTQCAKWNVTYHTLQVERNSRYQTSFDEQVRMFKNVGYVAGIHGANLMNVVFMHTFGGLMELANDETLCYFAGANSGLNYWHFQTSHVASVSESFCAPTHQKCNRHIRNRRIMIDKQEDRDRIVDLVDKGIRRLVTMHNWFGYLGGIPVVLNSTSSEYVIDWTQKRREE